MALRRNSSSRVWVGERVLGKRTIRILLVVLAVQFTAIAWYTAHISGTSTASLRATLDNLIQQRPQQREHAQVPLSSARTCTGETYSDDSWKYKSCHLQNVCYDGNWEGVFTYYADRWNPAGIPAPGDLAVSVSPLGATHAAIKFEPAVVLDDIPRDVEWADDDVTVLAVEYNGSNFGHVLGDSVFPWWRLLDMFGFEGDFQPIHLILTPPFTYSCAWHHERNPSFGMMDVCMAFYDKVATPLTGRKLVYLQERYNVTRTGPKRTCFRNLLVGIGLLADHGFDKTVHGRLHGGDNLDLHLIGGGPTLWRFRNAYMERLGLDPYRLPVPGHHDVVFSERKGRAWYDAKHAEQLLRSRLDTTTTDIVPPVQFQELTMKQQVDLLSSAKVFVTFPGGASYISLFLARGSTAIFIYGEGNVAENRQDYPLHNNMAHINVVWLKGNVTGPDSLVVFNDQELIQQVQLALQREPIANQH